MLQLHHIKDKLPKIGDSLSYEWLKSTSSVQSKHLVFYVFSSTCVLTIPYLRLAYTDNLPSI